MKGNISPLYFRNGNKSLVFLLEAKVFFLRETYQALAHIVWKTKRWREVLSVGILAKKARATTREGKENGLGDGNMGTESSKQDVPAETSGQRKGQEGHTLIFVNKVSPSPGSDTDSIEEAENCV